MKVLVLGGTRFIGLRLVHHLASQGHDITLLNRGRTSVQLPPGIKRLYADRRDPEAVRSALSGQEFEVVFDITGYEARNMEPMVELFAGKIKHYVFQSTAGVYARSNYLPTVEDSPRRSPITEEHGYAAYEVNKVECEDYLFKAYQETGFPVSILRCPMIYGPANWMHDREFSFFVRLLQGRTIFIPGNGASIMHFTYVDDLAHAHLSLVGNEKTFGQAFNIVSSQAITIDGYIDTMAEIIGVEAKKIYLDFQALKNLDRSVFGVGGVGNSFFDIHKAKEYFGFWPAHSVKEGLKLTYEWWQENLGIENTRFEPGRLGHDVDLDYETKLAEQYS